VTRRPLHLWVGGQRMQPANEEQVQRVLATARRIDRGAADLTRAALLAKGVKALDMLAAGRLEEVEQLLGRTSRSQGVPPSIAQQQRTERRPLPPDALIDTTQSGPHPATQGGKLLRTMKATRAPRRK
jgi:hypothetical protein